MSFVYTLYRSFLTALEYFALGFTHSFHFSIFTFTVVCRPLLIFWKIWKVHLEHCTISPFNNVELALVASCTRIDSHFLPNQNKTFNKHKANAFDCLPTTMYYTTAIKHFLYDRKLKHGTRQNFSYQQNELTTLRIS